MSPLTNEQKILKYLQSPVNYVSGCDGEIYFNNILLDECYDLQYAYREMKEPIYGYRDKYFNAILPGTVLITGQFSINYIHDGYLHSVLSGDKTLNANMQNTVTNLSKELGLNNTILQDGFNKKNLLQQYNELRKYYDTKVTLISDASSKVAILKAQLQDIDKKINDLEENKKQNNISTDSDISKLQDSLYYNNEERVDNAEENWILYQKIQAEYETNKNLLGGTGNLSGIEFTYASSDIKSNVSKQLNVIFDNDINTKDGAFAIAAATQQLNSLNEQYRREAEELIAPSWFNSTNNDYAKIMQNSQNAQLSANAQIENLKFQKDSINEKIAKYTTDSNNISEIKAQLDNIALQLKNPASGALMTQIGNYKKIDFLTLAQTTSNILNILDSNQSLTSYRPEDVIGKINIQFKYNDILHKTLEDIYLIGHTHYLGVGGEPIKETYQFVAKRII